MKINQIITESAITKSKAESILRLVDKHGLLDDSNSDKVAEVIASIVTDNPSTDLKQLFNMVKDKLGDEVDETGLGTLSDKRLGRVARTKGRSFKKSLNKLSSLISTHSGRFDKNLLSKLKNPVSVGEGL